MRRWAVAAGGVALMACLGTVYAWSVYTGPLRRAFGWSSAEATAPFSIAILFLGVGAVLGGRWQDRAGPRRVALAGALLWGAGNLLAGLGTVRFGVAWLCLTYGLVGGLGLGLGYVTPVPAVTKWFPDRRGLAGGLVVGGFGLGAFGWAHLLRTLPAFTGGDVGAQALAHTFTVSGLAFAAVGGAGAWWLRDPPAPRSPRQGPAAGGADFTPREMVRTPQFWAAFGMLLLNVTAGILFISSAVPILQELTGATPAAAAAAYGTIALANAAGRFVWGAVSDRIGRRGAFAAIYLVQVAVFLSVTRFHDIGVVASLFALVLLCYGGGFGVMPSLVADWFGTRHLGVNYGWVLLAWSAAGLAGPSLASIVKDRTGSYAGALPVTAALLALATMLPVLSRPPGPPRGRT